MKRPLPKNCCRSKRRPPCGSVVFARAQRPLHVGETFVRALGTTDVYWQLLARDLARHGGPFAGLAGKRTERHLGDLAAQGKGELIFVS